jgi:hypothetical protein
MFHGVLYRVRGQKKDLRLKPGNLNKTPLHVDMPYYPGLREEETPTQCDIANKP